MNRLTPEKQAQVVAALVEGCSIRATVRMTGVAKNTIAKLLVDLGAACSNYLDEHLVNLNCQRVQVDEIWSFCYAKAKNVTPEIARKNPHAGDTWTFTGIDAETKLIPCWLIGPRDAVTARMFINDLAGRLTERVELTTDGLSVYLKAVESAFGREIDFAQLVKIYGNAPEAEKRYSPAVCIGCEKHAMIGNRDPKHISMSYVERANLSMRMGVRRFTRLTNAFSKKIENHAAAVALYFMFYNFARVHKTLRCSPAMAAGVDNRLWETKDIVAMIEAHENSN